MSEEFTRELNRLRMTLSVDTEAKKTELIRIESQIDKLVTAIADGADALALNTKLKELEARKETVENELAQAPGDPLPLIHPNMAELYRRKVGALTSLLQDPESKDEAFETALSQ